MWLGDPAWPRAAFQAVFEGVLDGVESADSRTLSLRCRDKTERLNQPVQAILIPDGPHAITPAPLAFGRVRNISPVLADAAALGYLVHQGPYQALSAVRDNGAPTAATPDLAGGRLFLDIGVHGEVTADA